MEAPTLSEPTVSFRQAALKIQWSQVLIHNLGRVCAEFIEAKPYSITFERDPQTGRQLFKVGLTREVPPEVPLLMGDICGNLRASLDYAWMGLVRKENPGNPSKVTLPIADNRKGLASTIAKAPIQGSVKEVERVLVDLIKAHRDFANGGNEPLMALNDPSNWNKHNLMIATVGVTTVHETGFGDGNRISDIRVHGGEHALVSFGGEPSDVSYDREPTVEIVFDHPGPCQGRPVIPTLVDLVQVALQALHAFCEVFPDPRNPRFTH